MRYWRKGRLGLIDTQLRSARQGDDFNPKISNLIFVGRGKKSVRNEIF